jgi:hypothetical protein
LLHRLGDDVHERAVLERGGEVRAIFYRLPSSHRLSLTPLSPEQAGPLAVHLADLGHPLSGVTADHDTATVFAEAWQRHTGAVPVPSWRGRLYRLGTLTPPEPLLLVIGDKRHVLGILGGAVRVDHGDRHVLGVMDGRGLVLSPTTMRPSTRRESSVRT